MAEVRVAEVRVAEVRVAEVRVAEVRVAEVRAGEVRAAEFCAGKFCFAEICSGKINPFEGVFLAPRIPNIGTLLKNFNLFFVRHALPRFPSLILVSYHV